MEKISLVGEVKYLLFKYLEKDIAEKTFLDFEEAMKSHRNTGKEVLHILSSNKKFEFDESDRKKLKEVAFNLGI